MGQYIESSRTLRKIVEEIVANKKSEGQPGIIKYQDDSLQDED